MECIQSGTNFRANKLQILTNYSQTCPNITPWKFEEEEEEKCDYEEAPSNLEELSDWWNKFSQRYKYPLYCMVLATEVDEIVASLINNHHLELSILARDKCCFIYFRDMEKAKLLEPFSFSDHAKGVMKLIQAINFQTNNLPCLLFFEHIIEDEYVVVPIGNDSISKIMGRIREVFTHIYSCTEVSLSAVKMYKLSKQVKVVGKTVGKNLTKLAKDMVIDLLKSLMQVP